MDNLYKDEILEHYKNPSHFGKLVDYTVKTKIANPFCGDELELFVKYGPASSQQAKSISNISFTGQGCAISIASTSILTEFVVGKPISTLTKFDEKDMLELLGIEVSETRKKCALLGWSALKDCLQSISKTQAPKFK